MSLARAASLALATVLLAGCGSTSPPGRAEVYDRINALSDCAALQAEFNQADTNHTRDVARGSDLAEVDLSYMEAAEERMKAIGCH